MEEKIAKIISVGLVLCVVFSVFASVGDYSEASVMTIGDAFSILGAMVLWSVVTLIVFMDFFNKK